MTLLSLKEILLYGLSQASYDDCEDADDSFTYFLHNARLATHSLPVSPSLETPHWLRAKQTISLQKRRKCEDVLYISAIPQQLLANSHLIDSLATSKSSENKLEDVAQKVIRKLQEVRFESINSELDHKGWSAQLLAQLWAEFQIKTKRSGWISFQLSNRGIYLWLQQMQRCSDASQFSPGTVPSALKNTPAAGTADSSAFARQQQASAQQSAQQRETLLWQIQYAHARCCGLLRLLAPLQPERTAALSAASGPTLLLTSPTMAQLVHELIEVTDDMFWIPYRWPTQQYFLLLKRSAQLSQSFERFYAADISGFGPLLQASAQSVQFATACPFAAVFELLTATRSLLKALLQERFGANAPCEL